MIRDKLLNRLSNKVEVVSKLELCNLQFYNVTTLSFYFNKEQKKFFLYMTIIFTQNYYNVFLNTNKQEIFSEKNVMNNNTGSSSEDESNCNNDIDDNTSEEMIEMIDNYLNDGSDHDSDNEIIDEFDEDKWERGLMKLELKNSMKLKLKRCVNR